MGGLTRQAGNVAAAFFKEDGRNHQHRKPLPSSGLERQSGQPAVLRAYKAGGGPGSLESSLKGAAAGSLRGPRRETIANENQWQALGRSDPLGTQGLGGGRQEEAMIQPSPAPAGVGALLAPGGGPAGLLKQKCSFLGLGPNSPSRIEKGGFRAKRQGLHSQ